MTAALDDEATRPRPAGTGGVGLPSGFFTSRYGSTKLRVGVATTWLSVIVLLPLAAIVWQSAGGGWTAFWQAVTSNAALDSFRVTLTISVAVAVINAVLRSARRLGADSRRLPGQAARGRDDRPALRVADHRRQPGDAGALRTEQSRRHPHLQHTKWGVAIALLFVTLPFVVRSVQPVLLEVDREVEEAAASLGADNFTIFRLVILPALLPSLLSGAGLAFSRAIGEYGSVVLIGGAVPGETEVSSQ